jgi:hypothetical protein
MNLANPFDAISIHQNQSGEFVCAFSADDGKIIALVCADEECALLMAGHLSSMGKRAEVGEVAF